MTATPRLAIVIVAYREAEVLSLCLESISESTFQNYLVIIVDNSPGGELESLHLADREKVHYHAMGKNTGFCDGNNFGIKVAQEKNIPYILLLNQDTEVDPDCLEKLLSKAERESNCGAVTGKILMHPERDRIWYGGGYYNKFLVGGRNIGVGERDVGQCDKTMEVDYSTGCCFMVPTEVFSRIGLLDSILYMYFEDGEFSVRIRSNGLRIFYEPKAVLYHHLGAGPSIQSRPDHYWYFSTRNRPLHAVKGPYKLYAYFANTIISTEKIIHLMVARNVEHRVWKVKVILWGWFDSFSTDPKYRKRFPGRFG